MGFDVDRDVGTVTRRYTVDRMPDLSKIQAAEDSGSIFGSMYKLEVPQGRKKSNTLPVNDPLKESLVGVDPEKGLVLLRALGKLARTDPESAGELLAIMYDKDML